MADPDKRTNGSLYPNSNRRERIACSREIFAVPHCSAADIFEIDLDDF
jgi:hypothetical protein